MIILCTRPSLFQATKQAVAAKYLPSQQHRQRKPNAKHIKSCAEAARDITHLTRKLILTNQAAVLANVDYHFAFSAAVVLELVSLVPGQEINNDDEAIAFLAEYLQKAGESGNESAADCAQIVRDFKAIATTLRWQTVENQSNVTSTSNEDASGIETSTRTTNQKLIRQGSQGAEDFSFHTEGSNFFERQEATYDELFSWFIESPI